MARREGLQLSLKRLRFCFAFNKEVLAKGLAGRLENLRRGKARYTMIPYSELALHLGIAGKRGKITRIMGNWAVVELDGRCYEGLVSELVDVKDR